MERFVFQFVLMNKISCLIAETRAEKNPQLLELSLQGLSASVTELEKSHPKLVEIVNAICTTLSNLGI